MEAKRCPASGHEGMPVFIEIENMPVHCNLLWPSREQALNAPRGDIRLGFCHACGMIYNIAFDPGRIQYTQAYENSLHFSAHFQKYAEELALGLIEKYNLRNKNVIEIGCGNGEFLSMLCERGRNCGVGFDPSYDGGRNGSGATENITIICDFYSEAYAGYTADLICCRQVLEHIQYPHDFLLRLRRTIGEQRGITVFFEVPNVLYTLRDLGIWDLIYEHCSYFSAPSLTRLFQESGFEVLQVYATFGDQFLCLEASPAVGSHECLGSINELEQLSSSVAAFGENYRNKVKTWNESLGRLFDKGRRIVVWGAGSKGATFLNTMKVTDQIQYAVDINPRKQRMYVAGTGQQIVPPEFLREYRPDTVLVMNSVYNDEILNLLSELGLTAEVLTV